MRVIGLAGWSGSGKTTLVTKVIPVLVERGLRVATVKQKLQADGISFLLVQFVDIHGAAKVKLVPANALESVTHSGAGFAGGAVWVEGEWNEKLVASNVGHGEP